MWHIKDITIDQNNNAFRGTLEKVGAQYRPYIDLMNHRNTARYKVKDKGDVLLQVHLHISEYAQGEGNTFVIPISSVKKIDVYDPAVGATVTSYVSSGIGIGSVVLFVLLLIFWDPD